MNVLTVLITSGIQLHQTGFCYMIFNVSVIKLSFNHSSLKGGIPLQDFRSWIHYGGLDLCSKTPSFQMFPTQTIWNYMNTAAFTFLHVFTICRYFSHVICKLYLLIWKWNCSCFCVIFSFTVQSGHVSLCSKTCFASSYFTYCISEALSILYFHFKTHVSLQLLPLL